MLNVSLFIIGWVLSILAQAQNSIRSSTNGLQGWAGWKAWFQMHAIELGFRALISACLYGVILRTVASHVQSAGLELESYGIAGLGGITANFIAYQITGQIPGLRVEVGELAPPGSDQPPPSVGRIGN